MLATDVDPAELKIIPGELYVGEEERVIALLSEHDRVIQLLYLPDELLYGLAGSEECFDLRVGPIVLREVERDGRSYNELTQNEE